MLFRSRYAPKIEVLPDRPGISMNATKHRIRFDIKTLDALWLLGFNGWRSIETYAPAVVLSSLTFTSLEDALHHDEDIGLFEMDYKSRTQLASAIIAASDTSDILWPSDVPIPQSNRDAFSNNQDKVAFDLVCLATAYVLLHEIRHVMFINEGTAPSDRREEEIACDVWARCFLTDKLAAYATAANQEYTALLEKRSMAMALGALILYEITPEHFRWGTKEYPPIAYLMQAIVVGNALTKDSHYWLFAACLLVGIFRQTHRSLSIVTSSNKELAEWLISELL